MTEIRAMLPHATLMFGCVEAETVAGYAIVPLGQYFGGRSVAAQGVASVFVVPEWRRRGVAGHLLRDLVVQARRLGAAVAPLYASTTRLYRRWGWEVGDRTLTHRVRADALARFHGEGSARRSPGRAAVEALHREVAQGFDGPLDRPDWWLDVQWDTFADAHERTEYGWYEDDALTGYVRYRHAHPAAWAGPPTIDVHEFVAATPESLRGLLGLLGGHEAQASHITFKRATFPEPELLYLLPDVDKLVEINGDVCWMQRVVDIGRAVQQRGWPPHITARVELEVTDPCDESAARYVLEVAAGGGHAEPGGSGRVRCGIGALSAWYSSRLRASEALRVGLLDGPAADIEAMDALIAGRPARAPDYF